MASLTLEHIDKTFGTVEVIKDANLEIADGEFVVFVGPSGCGKSTLLRLIAGLEEATAGDIRIGGESVVRTAAAERGVAMVFQSYALYPHMTVRENLSFGLENMRMKKDDIAQRVDHAAKLLQIDKLLERKPRQLSGGQRQRVAIGRAITRDPKIFLFDEPLSNLDAELRVLMRLEIAKLHNRLKNTMIYVTHDQVEAMTMADRIVVLRGGVIEQVGKPLELYNKPRNKFVAGFIGSPRMNFVPAKVAGISDARFDLDCGELGTLTLPRSGLALQEGQPVTFGIRPEDLVVADAASNAWTIKVDVLEQHGSNTYLHCTPPAGTGLLVHLPGQSELKEGDRLYVRPLEGRWHVFGQDEQRLEPVAY
ncbi:ABC transporter ATP-binding protein [Usitatibacter palustris]|uniref:Maltose/maltodextrin import ATP-binding protein MalK n=1 Tax=Usitatibacter palustris TaxID=2732487 RepID=A0A6M4HB43_9PROT|nr:sn-glycerol-3-phosphate ABC transporter ATP-binding protein UgpC [Usitatibacter palustris]QJR15237.1 Maltose/maltodextrin import ATP-binding protein MalK [Usitatibacter palustris]